MRAFVTGIGGFVGRHLTAHLRASGDEVVGLTEGVDIADEAAVGADVAAADPEVVYHLAGWADVGGSWARPTEVARVNVAGTAAVLEAARRHGGCRVLVVGSADAYGAFDPGTDLPLREDVPLRPVTPYGASKAAAEVLAEQAFRSSGLPVIRTRSFNHTGPGQGTGFLAPALARRMVEARASGARTVGVGTLTARRDLLDVEDVVRAYRLLAERGEAGVAYNVCRGEAVTVQEVADRLLDLVGGGLRLEVDPALVRAVDVPLLVGDPRRIRAATGWEPVVPLEVTLERVVQDQLARVG